MKKKLLNLGCGGNIHNGWVNIDISSKNPSVIKHNLKNGIPFGDGEFNVVYHSHVLEHFTKNDALSFINECGRVLKSGGIIRICVPDLEQIARNYISTLEDALSGRSQGKENYEWMMLELLDQTTRNESGGEMVKFLQQPNLRNEDFIYARVGDEARGIRKQYLKDKNSVSKNKIGFRLKVKNTLKQIARHLVPWTLLQEIRIGRFRNSGEVHQWMYDRYSLAQLLKEAGFYNIQQVTANESSIPEWGTYKLDVSSQNRPRKPDSLYVEAFKK